MRYVRPYKALITGLFMTNMVYPLSFFLTFMTNLLYTIIVYFLWKSIYGTAETLHGMTFHQTFVQLTLSVAILNALRGASANIAGRISSGDIAWNLIRPLDLQITILTETTGGVLFGLLTNTFPSAIVVLLLVHDDIPIGGHIPIFLMSFVGAYLLNFTLEFMVGLLAFYTHAMWGIMVAKELVTTFFAGALIPVAFFPETIQPILRILPFQAIYHTPLQILTNTSLTPADYVPMLGIQLGWVVLLFILSRLFLRQALQVLTINGG